jgi:hypothetical protein
MKCKNEKLIDARHTRGNNVTTEVRAHRGDGKTYVYKYSIEFGMNRIVTLTRVP